MAGIERTNRIGGSERWDRLCSAGLGAAWFLVLCYAAWYRVRPWPDIILHIDFSSYWMAASLLKEGAGSSMFDMGTQYGFELNLRHQLAVTDFIRTDTGFNPYPNLPALALLYIPLTLLPMPWAYVVCWTVNFVASFAAVAMSLRGYPLGRTATILMLSFVAVTTSLFEGQPYGLFLLDLSAALLLLRSGRPFLGSLLLGLMWLKPQYAVIFPVVFLWKRRWMELAGTAVSGAVVAALSVYLVGIDGIVAYVRLLQGIGSLRYEWVDPWAMTNWRSLVMNLVPSISDETGSALVLLLGAATVFISLSVWRGAWDPNSHRFPRQVLVTVLAVILASPHSHIHGAVFLLPPLALSMSAPEGEFPLERVWRLVLGLGCLLSLAVWPFGMPRWIMVPFFLTAMGILLVQCRTSPYHQQHMLAESV